MSDEGEILLGRWDCSSCGTKGVLGDAYRCSSCGAGRPDDVRFYLPTDAEVIRDAAGVAAAEAGADWKCEYCSQWVAATETKCPSCAGGEVAGSKRQATSETTSTPGPRVIPTARGLAVGAAVSSNTKKSLAAPFACVSAVLLGSFLVVLGSYFLFRTSTYPATVAEHNWVRTQRVEEHKTLNQDGWDLPADAFNVRSERREHHKIKVLDHYESRTRTVHDRVSDGTERVKTGTKTKNLGNGRFKREPVYSTRTKYKTVSRTESYTEPIYRHDPVYQDYYFYNVNRWVAGESRVERGTGLAPRWPSTAVRDSQQRMAAREESYSLLLTELGQKAGEAPRTWTYELPEATWRNWPKDAVVMVTLRLGSVIKVESPEAAK